MSDRTEPRWAYASLRLEQPGWPGRKRATWVARTEAGELFHATDALAAMNRLGSDGWELVAFFPELGDRPSCFYFKCKDSAPTEEADHD